MESVEYIKDQIEIYIKYQKYKKLLIFFIKNNIGEIEMINVLLIILRRNIRNDNIYNNLLEYSEIIKCDNLLKMIVNTLKENYLVQHLTVGIFSKRVELTLAFLIYSKKTEIFIDLFQRLNMLYNNIKWNIEVYDLILVWNLDLKVLFEFFLKNSSKEIINNFFYFYNLGLLKNKDGNKN